jgi:hypothetical protein
MPYSYNAYTGNGSTTQFTIGFPYIRQEHVKVYVAYVDTAYTYVNNTTVQLATAPGAGVRVEVRRITPVASVLVDFADGSTLVAADLDTSNLQHLYLEQELDDYSKQTISIDPATGLLTAANQRITNVADPVNAQDVATKAYTDAQIDSALVNDVIAGTGLTISDNTPTAGQITVGITNSGVGVTQIADGAVTSAKIADATIITGDLADGAVTSAKIADGTIVAGDLASDSVTTAKILNANVTTAKIADLNVTTGKIADLGVTTGKIADAAVTAAKIAGGSIDSTKLDGATVVTNSEHSGSTPNDTSFFTTSASDARYFRQDSSETISSGQTWSASDSYIATTAAIDARVIDLVDDVGGFVPIANENSFPVANPDINNPDGTGTIVSIAVMSTSRTPSSGTVTIANGSGSNTVTITGCGSTVLAAGFGVLVETTSTLHTYTFHRLTPKATEVTTVASISADVTTVAGNNANVTAVAGNAANIATVGGSIANVNAVGGSIANVNSVASNLASVNSFANTYRIAASDPATSLDVGDLVFNTTASELRVYNGSVWQGGVTATGNLVSRAGDTMTGALVHPLGAAATPSITFTGDTNTGIYSPGADQVAVATNGTGRLFINALGQVGVGTSSPSEPLDVVSASGTARAIRVRGRSADNIGLIDFYSSDNATRYATIGAGAANTFVVETANNERLRVDSSGRVGIGTSTPSALLHVSSTGAVESLLSGGGTSGDTVLHLKGNGNAYKFIVPNSAAQYGMGLYDVGNAAYRLYVTSAGNVGVGTTSPSLAFVVSNSGAQGFEVQKNSGTLSGGIELISYNRTTSAYSPVLYDASFHAFGISNSEKARIDSSGRVGIGTSTVSTILNIRSNSSDDGILLEKNDGTGVARLFFDGTSSDARLDMFSGGAAKIQLKANGDSHFSGGRVGIGTTTPGATLDVAGSNGRLYLRDGSTNTAKIVALNAAGTGAASLIFETYNAETARIDSSGRLLIGTSSARSNVREGTDSETPKVQFESASNDYSGAGLSIINNSSSGFAPQLWLGRSASDSIGGNALVSSGRIGSISFNAADGTNFIQGARIQAELDETSGPGDLPTRLIFSTTANAASTPTERMRLTSEGRFFVPGVWDFSTSSGTAVLVTSDDQIRKAASSIKYKTDVEELQDSYADQILNIRPVWYRSLCDGDDPNHSYWGFIAEEVAEMRLVPFTTTPSSSTLPPSLIDSWLNLLLLNPQPSSRGPSLISNATRLTASSSSCTGPYLPTTAPIHLVRMAPSALRHLKATSSLTPTSRRKSLSAGRNPS